MLLQQSHEFTVRYTCGAYVTQTVRGRRASTTHSPAEAARRLGEKLFGAWPRQVVQLEAPELAAGVTRWRVVL